MDGRTDKNWENNRIEERLKHRSLVSQAQVGTCAFQKADQNKYGVERSEIVVHLSMNIFSVKITAESRI